MRRFAILGFVATVALGLASRKLGPVGVHLWEKSFGDAAYAVMFGFLALSARPSLAPRHVGVVAFAICFALELFQLTGLPRQMPPALRFLLGTAFAWHDVACYAVGALAVAGLVALARRRVT